MIDEAQPKIRIDADGVIPAAEILQQLRWIAANITDIRYRLDRMAEEAARIKNQ